MGGPAAQAINSQAQRPIRAHHLAAHSILEVRSSLAQRPLRPTGFNRADAISIRIPIEGVDNRIIAAGA